MMKYFRHVISASLSPNTEPDDVWRALLILLAPWKWQRGADTSRVSSWFTNRYKDGEVTLYNSGRSALFAILSAFGIGAGDEVIVQAFTCVAVPNGVLWVGAKPVYADIDDTYNLSVSDIEKKITKKTKAIIVQHTFGVPADITAIVSIARAHRILIIEDCAHALGATHQGKQVGTFGDAAFFSFGRDKIVSSVWGGAAIISSKHKKQIAKLKEDHDNLPMPGMIWVMQQIFHPIMFSIILPFYNMEVGKILLVLLQKLKLLTFPVYPEEKIGKRPGIFPAQYPNALAVLLVGQLSKLDRYTQMRQNIALVYAKQFETVEGVHISAYVKEAAYLRYPMLVNDPNSLRARVKSQGILLGNWYHNIIDPNGVDFGRVGYKQGSCPKAEYAAKHSINLPTKITKQDAHRICTLIG